MVNTTDLKSVAHSLRVRVPLLLPILKIQTLSPNRGSRANSTPVLVEI